MALGDATAYRVVIYATPTGRIVAELPVADDPTWSRLLNDTGAIGCSVVLGDAGVPTVETLRGLCVPWRFSLAVLWGDWVCQAGPITAPGVGDDDGLLTLTAAGFWALLHRRILHHPAWNPTTTKLSSPAADLTLTDSLPNLARSLVRGSVNWTGRPGSALPVDIDANTGTGTNTRTYYGYDLASVGQRLQELSQVDTGPDIDFAPVYDPAQATIRHRMMVGRVSDGYLVQPGNQPVFDYGSSLQSLSIDEDGTNVATSVFVRGAGNEREQLAGYAAATALTDAGWPALDYVDTEHTSNGDPKSLSSWASAGLALRGKATEEWKAVCRTDDEPRLGTYYPGTWAVYNVTGHPWLVDQQYPLRILGMSGGRSAEEVVHHLEARGAF